MWRRPQRRVITLHKAQSAAAKFFWSMTLYTSPTVSSIANPLERYSIGDRTGGLNTAQTVD